MIFTCFPLKCVLRCLYYLYEETLESTSAEDYIECVGMKSTALVLTVVALARAEPYIGTYGAKKNAPVVPLVTGCGRSGTHTAGELLLSLGIKAVHEGAAKDAVAVSWFYGTENSFQKSDEVIKFEDAASKKAG
jgi:hypothetical protein